MSRGRLESILRRGTKWGGQDLKEQELQGERMESGSWLPSNCHFFIFPHPILPWPSITHTKSWPFLMKGLELGQLKARKGAELRREERACREIHGPELARKEDVQVTPAAGESDTKHLSSDQWEQKGDSTAG